MTVFRDSGGSVINIGPWDYMEIPDIDEEKGEVTIINLNPLPEGATSQEEDVVTLDDGGYAAANP